MVRLYQPFNRTIVELKRPQSRRIASGCPPFNRTIVELKLPILTQIGLDIRTFNRTIVELKHVIQKPIMKKSKLLIEPLWN